MTFPISLRNILARSKECGYTVKPVRAPIRLTAGICLDSREHTFVKVELRFGCAEQVGVFAHLP